MGQERSKSSNFSLVVKSALSPPASSTMEKTEATSSSTAARCTVVSGRSSFQVTPCPPASASMRRPVSIPVWLGRVTFFSWAVRALSVLAPSPISRCSVGARSAPSRRIAAVLSPSTEIASTRGSAPPAGAATRAEAGTGAPTSRVASPAASAAPRRIGASGMPSTLPRLHGARDLGLG